MSGHGKSRHLKRIAAPKNMPIARKTYKWVKKPIPGSHGKAESIPALIVLREILGVAVDNREVKKILKSNDFLVDGRPIKETGFPVGLMDVVTLPKSKAHYRVIAKKEGLVPVQISAEQAKQKLCKVRDKTAVGKNRIQLNLHDGRTYLIEKEEDQFKTGDTVKISIPKQKLEGFLKLEKGATCYIYKGKHSGKIGTLEKIIDLPYGTPGDAVLKDDKGVELITLKDYLFVVDKEFRA